MALKIHIPSRKLTYPTWGKGKSSSKCQFLGDMLVPWRVIFRLTRHLCQANNQPGPFVESQKRFSCFSCFSSPLWVSRLPSYPKFPSFSQGDTTEKTSQESPFWHKIHVSIPSCVYLSIHPRKVNIPKWCFGKCISILGICVTFQGVFFCLSLALVWYWHIYLSLTRF